MDLLTFSEILFNLVGSLTIIVLGILLGLSIYYFLKTAKSISEIAKKLSSASDEIKNKLALILEKLSALPLLSFLSNIRSNTGKKETAKKGRNVK